MQRAAKKIINKRPSADRRNPLPAKNGSGKNGSGQARANDRSIAGTGFHLLAKGLRPVSLFEILMRIDHGADQVILKMIDTEAKQLQAINDLYLIIKAQPKYAELKEPNWDASTPPVVVLQWILRKLGPLAEGNPWTVDIYKEGRKIRYRFCVTKSYHQQKVQSQSEIIPIDFLPDLAKRDLPLHDMIIDTIALVSRENKIPLWDEDGDYSAVLKSLDGLQVLRNELINEQIHSYRHGLAMQYLQIIKQRRVIVTIADLFEQMRNYDAKSERKQSVIWWIRQGIDLAGTKCNIGTNTFIPNYITGNPITPFRLYKFVWSQKNDDVVQKKVIAKRSDDREKYGSYFPIMFSITKPGEVVSKIKALVFPEELYGFMSYGNSVFHIRYKDYFHRIVPEKKTLIDVFNRVEIQNL